MLLALPCPLAAILPADPARFRPAVMRAAALGFTHIEISALPDRPADHLDALADAGVLVACAMLSGAPGNVPVEVRRNLLRQQEREVADAARLGATCAVLTAGGFEEPMQEAAFSEFCTLLARYAAKRMISLAVRPLAGTALPDALTVLAWLNRTGCDHLGLAVEDEEPSRMRQAGARLFHVRLREKTVEPALGAVLAEIGYRGVVGVLPREC